MNRIAKLLGAIALLALGAACVPLDPALEAPRVLPELQGQTIQMRDGTKLPLAFWAQEGELKAVILGVHGLNDHGRSFDQPARLWARRGIATYAFDQRGFGGAPQRGRWPGTDQLIADFGAAVAAVRAAHPGVPIYAAGHSMGGAVVLAAMARSDAPALDGIILEAPAVQGRATMAPHAVPMLPLLAGALGGHSCDVRARLREAADDEALRRQIDSDEAVLKTVRVDVAYGLVNLMDTAYAAPERIAVPVLLLYGEKDALVPREPIADVARALPAPRRRIAVYAEGFHILRRGRLAETVAADIAAWIADRAAPLPSGADQTKAARDLVGLPQRPSFRPTDLRC